MGEDQTRRWRRMPEERPAQIIEAALEVFGARGLAGARLDEIAERAGISKGTIYLYFENKDALFRAVVRQTVETLESLARAERRGSAETRLRLLAGDVWSFLRTPAFQTVYRLVIAELHQFPELARFYSEQVSGRVSGAVAALLEAGVERGEFRPLEPVPTARMLLALVLQHALWCERRALFQRLSGLTDDDVLAQMLDFFLGAVRAAPAPGGA